MTFRDPVLPTDSDARKEIPIFSGVLDYFPLAIAAVARVSKRGNDQHNPGQPLHWARDKSTDQEDCIARHLIDVDTLDPVTGEYADAAALAWRALAKLQLLEEKRLGKPPSRGSRTLALPLQPAVPPPLPALPKQEVKITRTGGVGPELPPLAERTAVRRGLPPLPCAASFERRDAVPWKPVKFKTGEVCDDIFCTHKAHFDK